jgi:hypothetical protein
MLGNVVAQAMRLTHGRPRGGSVMPKEERFATNGKHEPHSTNMFGLGNFAHPGVEAAMRAGDVWLKGLGSLNEEMLSFSQEQINKYMEASQSLLQCSSLDQALIKQQELARGTIESYSREATKLLDLTSEIARKTWSQPGQSAGAAGED